jgi:hypothetical protein
VGPGGQHPVDGDEPPVAIGIVEHERQGRGFGPGGRAERHPKAKGEPRQETGANHRASENRGRSRFNLVSK